MPLRACLSEPSRQYGARRCSATAHGEHMTQFSSRDAFPDTLAQRRTESWYGTAPVTLTRGDVQINGSRQGRFGGVMVYRPERDVDFGPDRGRRVWNDGMFAELDDEEWERMGWVITVRQANATNRILTRLRASLNDPNGFAKTGNLSKLDIPTDDATPEECKHALKVLIRLPWLRELAPVPALTTPSTVLGHHG